MRAPSPISLVLTSLVAASLTLLAYWPGTQGALYYDDYASLKDLSKTQRWVDALGFILSGETGPLGRPIALASFVPQAAAWPDNTQDLLAVNVFIHVLNAVLLGQLVYMVMRLRQAEGLRAGWIALGAAWLWSLMPLLASTSLILIQRMTTLSATFSLLGLVGFVAAYPLRAQRPRLAFLIQYGALAIFTLLGVFTKENAALTPLYALLIDSLLLNRLTYPKPWQYLSRAILLAALALIIWYLSPLHLDWWGINEDRGWSSWQRLQYQAVLLWEYVRLLLSPLPTAFGPFHDVRTLSDYSFAQSILAACAWCLAIGAGAWLLVRQRNPWLLFAILWFLTGHLLESTVINLELMFEHRNYLAAFGIAWALAVAAAHAPGRLSRIAPVLFLAFVCINGLSLFAMTRLWGNPEAAAETWAARYPSSPRAAMHAASILTAARGPLSDQVDRLELANDIQRAIVILDRTAHYCPDCADVRLNALLLTCYLADRTDIKRRLDDLMRLMQQTGRINVSVADAFFILDNLVSTGQCPTLSQDDLLRLIDSIDQRSTPISAPWLARILFVGARIHYENQRYEQASLLLDKAERAQPLAQPILEYQVDLYKMLGRPDEALAAIERRRRLDPQKTGMTDQWLDELERSVKNP
ncbi:tetratricopeptide repeat protein [Caldichromatium japonicum]|uniref:Tetratricopeptide repeat protein n=1 Tax=Caldichromatium japonicum TaxID=2699430 RepID=A0A6G7VEN1_9GAMM|nr:tetratricopeptide repeat protein [Caldichromatium japonicum]QIK38345.1 tetratricopeptide repeat protein [Caldichromatium japonicum]